MKPYFTSALPEEIVEGISACHSKQSHYLGIPVFGKFFICLNKKILFTQKYNITLDNRP